LDSYIPARILLFNKSKESRLLSAADQGNLNLVRKLIYAGADTNHRDAIVILYPFSFFSLLINIGRNEQSGSSSSTRICGNL
jgi:hypothetical protein